jgi:hypothetical protein
LTDELKKRTVPGAEERILKDLRWAGLEWDEGMFSAIETVIWHTNCPFQQALRLVVHMGRTNRLEAIVALLRTRTNFRSLSEQTCIDLMPNLLYPLAMHTVASVQPND